VELASVVPCSEEARVGRFKVRKSVDRFAQQMEKNLRGNDHKGGWEGCTAYHFFEGLCDEAEELRSELNVVGAFDPERVIEEAADIANFAMMIADVARSHLGR
jgi:hypothetical protein